MFYCFIVLLKFSLQVKSERQLWCTIESLLDFFFNNEGKLMVGLKLMVRFGMVTAFFLIDFYWRGEWVDRSVGRWVYGLPDGRVKVTHSSILGIYKEIS